MLLQPRLLPLPNFTLLILTYLSSLISWHPLSYPPFEKLLSSISLPSCSTFSVPFSFTFIHFPQILLSTFPSILNFSLYSLPCSPSSAFSPSSCAVSYFTNPLPSYSLSPLSPSFLAPLVPAFKHSPFFLPFPPFFVFFSLPLISLYLLSISLSSFEILILLISLHFFPPALPPPPSPLFFHSLTLCPQIFTSTFPSLNYSSFSSSPPLPPAFSFLLPSLTFKSKILFNIFFHLQFTLPFSFPSAIIFYSPLSPTLFRPLSPLFPFPSIPSKHLSFLQKHAILLLLFFLLIHVLSPTMRRLVPGLACS